MVEEEVVLVEKEVALVEKEVVLVEKEVVVEEEEVKKETKHVQCARSSSRINAMRHTSSLPTHTVLLKMAAVYLLRSWNNSSSFPYDSLATAKKRIWFIL